MRKSVTSPPAERGRSCGPTARPGRRWGASPSQPRANGRRSAEPPDELIGDRVEVLPDVVRLRADLERGVALAKDQRRLPAGRASTDRVPDMARDQADVTGIKPKRGGHRVVSLRRWLVAPHGLVNAEAALEQAD